MANTTYTDYFTGSIVDPTDVSYLKYALTSNIQLVWPSYLPPIQPGATAVIAVARNIDVTPTGGSWTISLPQGNLGSAGADILITNRGSIGFTVADVTGAQSTAVAPGASYYFYLSDNSTVTGTWTSTGFGIGTSAADANVLAGSGLISLNGRLNEQIPVIQFGTQGFVLADNSRANCYVWTGGLGTLQLPLLNTLSANWFIGIRNQGSGTLTISPSDPLVTINGANVQLIEVGTSAFVILDTSNRAYFTLGSIANQNFSWSSATFDTSAIPTNSLNLTQGAQIIQRYVDIGGTRSTNLAVTLPASAAIYSFINSTANTNYNITFTVFGSTASPLVLKANEQNFAVSDGINLYSLGTQTIGSFALNDGSALAPTLFFNTQSNVGLYKPGTSQLGVTVGGSNVITFNGTDPSNLTVVSPAAATFRSIDGGLI